MHISGQIPGKYEEEKIIGFNGTCFIPFQNMVYRLSSPFVTFLHGFLLKLIRHYFSFTPTL